ncbi:Epimerase domain-containing protein [Aphelenchoides fujianensis]|nr:Epimerase domain-containing protein [Aphelenchoides fujianensis]
MAPRSSFRARRFERAQIRNVFEFAVQVLVTGASGYIATHIVQQLLQAGYRVVATVRSLQNETKIRPLRDLEFADERLELKEADLGDADCWLPVVAGCDYVLHVASPFPLQDDESIIQIAVDGTLNVLRACAKTPSGHADEDREFDENDWTNLESPKVLFYAKSKTIAEQAAWKFVEENTENKFKLTALNPTFTMKKFLTFEVPAIPPLQMGMVDVRDVAQAHILAMTRPESDGERILVTQQPSWSFRRICTVLSEEFKPQGYTIPFLNVPYAFVWLYSFISVEARASLCRLNRKVVFNNEKSKKLLGLEYRDVRSSIIEMAYSIIERGIAPKKSGYKGPPSVSEK